MVFLEHLGLRVQIVVNDFSAKEIIPDEHVKDEDGVVGLRPFICNRYIESTANATFFISVGITTAHGLMKDWIDSSRDNRVSFRISVDGQYVGSTRVGQEKKKAVFCGVNDHTNNTTQTFQFAAISPIEDATKEQVAEHIEQSKDLGTIQVCVHRLVRTGSSVPRHRGGKPEDPNGFNGRGLARGDEIALAEKALKGRALLHGTTLGPVSTLRARPSNNPTVTLHNWVDEKTAPLAVVTFMYRSRDALKQELIIPRTPSPKPSPAPKSPNVADLPLEKIRRLAQERLSDLQDRKRDVGVKHERQDIARPPRPSKYIRLSNGRQAIDLTEDD